MRKSGVREQLLSWSKPACFTICNLDGSSTLSNYISVAVRATHFRWNSLSDVEVLRLVNNSGTRDVANVHLGVRIWLVVGPRFMLERLFTRTILGKMF